MNKLSDISRRDFVKTSAYVAPLIVTLNASPALASIGSPKKDSDIGDRRFRDRGRGGETYFDEWSPDSKEWMTIKRMEE
jgi:hypothetical protein